MNDVHKTINPPRLSLVPLPFFAQPIECKWIKKQPHFRGAHERARVARRGDDVAISCCDGAISRLREIDRDMKLFRTSKGGSRKSRPNETFAKRFAKL